MDTALKQRWKGLPHRLVRAGGTRLHVIQTGEDQSRPVMVLISGWPQSIYVWRKVQSNAMTPDTFRKTCISHSMRCPIYLRR